MQTARAPPRLLYLGPNGWQSTAPSTDFRRDTLSSTHHEGGTLWMGDDPATTSAPNRRGVADVWGRLHETDNLYAVGPSNSYAALSVVRRLGPAERKP